MTKKAVKIHIVYDDGSQDIATGTSAAEIVDWLFGCQNIAYIHGIEYSGPQLLVLNPEGNPVPQE